ncbi:MAG: hypothetical protein ACFCVA_01985 [Gammaproteobacteria bacterium]
MHHLTQDHLLKLLAAHQPPCISLYQPTHRHYPENHQDPIRFKNLIREIEESLRRQYPTRDVRELLQPFQALAANGDFWNHTRDGLAMFVCHGILDSFQLQRSLPERVVVADSFHLKPLFRYLQSADRFQVLSLTRDSAMVFEGDRYALDAEVPSDDFPSRLEQVVPPPRTEPGMSVASSSAGVGSPKMLRGHDEGKQAIDTEKFFRAVDRAVTAQFSKPSGLPLVLASLSEQQALFRRVSQNPLLLAEGVNGNPAELREDELRQQVWQVLEPHYLARLQQLQESYHAAAARQAGSADLADVAKAAVFGRVGTLLVEAERTLPGLIDPASGSIRPAELGSRRVDDMLDDLAELVFIKGGNVVVVPGERMPTSSGLAAIYRF